MTLRESLRVTLPSPGRVDEFAKLTRKIIHAIDNEADSAELIAEMASLARRKDFDRDFFATLHCRCSVEDFATEAALPMPQHVPDLSRDELIEIVRLAKSSGYVLSIYYRELFDRNVPMPGASGLLDYPENWKRGMDLSKYDPTPEEIVDRATAAKNIIRL